MHWYGESRHTGFHNGQSNGKAFKRGALWSFRMTTYIA